MKRMPTDRLLALGMAVYADRRTMEQRVRSIFFQKRSALPMRLAALAFSMLLCAACFTTACTPGPARSDAPAVTASIAALPPEETPPPTLEALQAAMDGERIAFHSGSLDGDYTFVYAGEDEPLGEAGARDPLATADPRDAAIRAAKLLVGVYGGQALTAPYTVRYLYDAQTGPLYIVTVEDTLYEGQTLLAALDAKSTTPRYFCTLCAPYAETADFTLTSLEAARLTEWDAWRAGSAGEWMRLLLADEYDRSNVDWDAAPQPLADSTFAAEPFLLGDGDVKLRMLLHMPEGESYDIAWLEDVEDFSMSVGLLSAAFIEAGAWESYDPDLWGGLLERYLPRSAPRPADNRWLESLHSGDGGTVFVNAAVIVRPDMPAKTVRLVSQPILQERVDAIVEAFAPGAPLYAYRADKTDEPADAKWKTGVDKTQSVSVWADVSDNADLLITGESGARDGAIAVSVLQPGNGAIGTILRHDYEEGAYQDRVAQIFGLTDVRLADGVWMHDGRTTYSPAYDGVPVLRAFGSDFLPNELWLEMRGAIGVGAGFGHPCEYGAETPLAAPLLTLVEMQQAVRDRAVLLLGSTDPARFRITALTQCWVPEYDAAAREYRLIPAWNVYGYDAESELDARWQSTEPSHALLMTLRASDGTPVAAAESGTASIG